MSASLLFALACAIIAIAYGVVSIKWIMAKPTGNARMREIAAAIQQGASAYLYRQYLTIGFVGVVLFLVIGFSPIGWPTAIGFAIGAILSGLPASSHERLRPRERPHGAGGQRRPQRGPADRLPRGAITACWSSASASWVSRATTAP